MRASILSVFTLADAMALMRAGCASLTAAPVSNESVVGGMPGPRGLQHDRGIDLGDERRGFLSGDGALAQDLTSRIHQAVLGTDLVHIETQVVGWHGASPSCRCSSQRQCGWGVLFMPSCYAARIHILAATPRVPRHRTLPVAKSGGHGQPNPATSTVTAPGSLKKTS